jgi:hypothetical protein
VTDLLAKPWLSFNVDFKIFNFTPNFVPLPLLAEKIRVLVFREVTYSR